MKKLIYLGFGFLFLLGILFLAGRKSVHHEIIINASVGQVWQTLTTVEEYPDWNPVMDLLEGSLQEGENLRYRFTQDESTSINIEATVVQIVPNELLHQKGGIPLVLTFNHRYILEPIKSSTKVIIHEDYSGIGVNFWNPQPVEEAYKRLNIALKESVEQSSSP